MDMNKVAFCGSIQLLEDRGVDGAHEFMVTEVSKDSNGNSLGSIGPQQEDLVIIAGRSNPTISIFMTNPFIGFSKKRHTGLLTFVFAIYIFLAAQ